MFLRATKRFKDGKVHYYWSMVENVRVGRRVFQRKALYLGELNDSQRSEWQRAVEASHCRTSHRRRYQATPRLKKQKCSEDLRRVS